MQRTHQSAHGQPPLGDLVNAESHHHGLADIGQQADDHIHPNFCFRLGKLCVGGFLVILFQRLQVFPLYVVYLDGGVPVDQIADHDIELFQGHRIEIGPFFQCLPLHGGGHNGAHGGNNDDHRQIAVDVQQCDHTGDQYQNAVGQFQAGDIIAVHQHLDLIVQRGDIVLSLLFPEFPGRHINNMRHDLPLEAEQSAVPIFPRAELPGRLKQQDAQNAGHIAQKHGKCAVCACVHRINGILKIDRLQ